MKRTRFLLWVFYLFSFSATLVGQINRTRLSNSSYSLAIGSDQLNFFALDLNGDNSADASMNFVSNGSNWSLELLPVAVTNISTQSANPQLVKTHYAGNLIDASLNWSTSNSIIGDQNNENLVSGLDQYIGLSLNNSGLVKYGWLRIQATLSGNTIQLKVKDYGIQQTNNLPIYIAPDNTYITVSDLSNTSLTLNKIQTTAPTGSVANDITMVYDQYRFQDEQFAFQYAVLNPQETNFSGYIQIIPDLGSALELQQLNFSLINGGGTQLNWVDDYGKPTTLSNFQNGNIYYLKVQNMPKNALINLTETIEVVACLTQNPNSVKMRLATQEVDFSQTSFTLPHDVSFEEWKLVGENFKVDFSGTPSLFLSNTIRPSNSSNLSITQTIDVSNWNGQMTNLFWNSSSTSTHPTCPGVNNDHRTFSYVIRKETDDQQVLRNIKLHISLNATGTPHSGIPDNSSYLPINQMVLQYVDETGTIQSISLNTPGIIERRDARLRPAAGYGPEDFGYLIIKLPYNLTSINQEYRLSVNEYIMCPDLSVFQVQSRSSWPLVYEYERDCGNKENINGEYFTNFGGTMEGIGMAGKYERKPVRMAGPRVRDLNTNGSIELPGEYLTTPQIYNFNYQLTSPGPGGRWGNYLAVDNPTARVFVVLKSDQGFLYTCSTSTFSSPFVQLAGPAFQAYSPFINFRSKPGLNHTLSWNPVIPEGLDALAGTTPLDNVPAFQRNATHIRVFEFDVAQYQSMNTGPIPFQWFLLNGANLNFTMETECPTSGFPTYTVEFYLQTSQNCTTCILPLNQTTESVQVDCPGCNYPGGAGNFLTVERQSLGYLDANGNRIADGNGTILDLATARATNIDADLYNDVRLDMAMQGDTVRISGSYFLTDGHQTCTSENGPDTDSGPSPFDNFTYSYLEINNPMGHHFTQRAYRNGPDLNVRIRYEQAGTPRVAEYVIPAGSFASVATLSPDQHRYTFDFSLSTLSPFWVATSDAPPSRFRSFNTIEFDYLVEVTGNETSGDPKADFTFRAAPYFSATAQNPILRAPQLNCGGSGFYTDNNVNIYDPAFAFLCEDFATNFNLVGINTSLIAAGRNGVHFNNSPICLQGRYLYLITTLNKDNFLDVFPNEVRVIPRPTSIRIPVPTGYTFDGRYSWGPALNSTLAVTEFYSERYATSVFYGEDMNAYINNPVNLIAPIANTSDGFALHDVRILSGPLVTESNQLTLTAGNDLKLTDESYYFLMPYTMRPTCSGTTDHASKPINQADRITVRMNANTFDWKRNIQTTSIQLDDPTNALLPFMAPDHVQSPLYLQNQQNGGNNYVINSRNYRNLPVSLKMDIVYGDTGNGFPAAAPTGWENTYLTVTPNANLNGVPVLNDPATGNEMDFFMIGSTKVYRLGRMGYDAAAGPMLSRDFWLDASTSGAVLSCINNGAIPVSMKFIASCDGDPTSLTDACYTQDVSLNLISSQSNWTNSVSITNAGCANPVNNYSRNTITQLVTPTGSGAVDGLEYRITLPSNLDLLQSSVVVQLSGNNGLNKQLVLNVADLVNSEYTLTKSGNNYTLLINNSVFSDFAFVSNAAGIPNYNQLLISFDVTSALSCSYLNTPNGIVLQMIGRDICSSTMLLQNTTTPNLQSCSNYAAVASADEYEVCIGTPVAVGVTVTGGVPAYQYKWKAANGQVVSTTQNFTFPSIFAGSYSFFAEVTDANGCMVNSQVITILVHPQPTVTVSPDQSVCSGSSVILNAAGASTYRWSTGQTTASITVSPTVSTTYFVIGVDANGCSDTAYVLVTVRPNPVVSINTPVLSCPENTGGVSYQDLLATVTGGTPAYAYVWSTGATTASIHVCPQLTSSYSVQVTDSYGCIGSASTQVRVGYDYELSVNPKPYVCGDTKPLCVTLNKTNTDVDNGIIGMDYAFTYDKTLFKLLSTNVTIESDLGPVVTRNLPSYKPGVYLFNDIPSTSNEAVVHLSLYYKSTSATNSTFQGQGKVATVCFTVLKNDISVTPYVFKKWELQEAYTLFEKDRCLKQDTFKVDYDPVFKGRLFYMNTAKYLGYTASLPDTDPAYRRPTDISATNSSCVSDASSLIRPDDQGQFNVTMSSSNTIKIERDIDNTYGPSTGTAANTVNFRLLRYVNGLDANYVGRITTLDTKFLNNPGSVVNDATRKPIGLQMIAADVNRNGKIRANDITLMQKRSVALIQEYPQHWNYDTLTNTKISGFGNSLDWVFIDKETYDLQSKYKMSTTFPSNDGSGFYRDKSPVVPFCLSATRGCIKDPRKTVHGILLGDVIDVSSTYPTKGDSRVRTNHVVARISIDLNMATYVGNNTYKVDVVHQVPEADTLVSIDFGINYNESKLEILEVLSSNADGVNMIWNDYQQSELLLTSYTLGRMKSQSSYYSLTVRKVDSSAIVPADFGATLGLLNGYEVPLTISGRIASVNDGNDDAMSPFLNVIPSPSKGITRIEFAIPDKGAKRIVITNPLGQVVKEYLEVPESGIVEFDADALANGLYICTAYGENSEALVTRFNVIK